VLADLAGRVQRSPASRVTIDMDRLTAGRTGLSVTRIEDQENRSTWRVIESD